MNFKYYNTNEIYDQDNLFIKLDEIKKNKNIEDQSAVCGAIRIFENGKLIQDVTSNIVTAMGRQYVAQKLFEISHPAETEIPNPSDPSLKPIWQWKISHFGLGCGGSVVVGNGTNLLGPTLCDLDLYDALPLTGSPADPAYLKTPGDAYRNIEPKEYVLKPIIPTGTIDIVGSQDIICSFGKVYSYVRIICSKFPGEPNYLPNDDDYLNINEAALFLTDGGKKSRIFSHICFPSKYIEKKSELVIEWYIIC